MTNVTVSATDLRALLDVTEGYASEHGLDSVQRYAMPQQVRRAIRKCQHRVEPGGNSGFRTQLDETLLTA